MNTDVSVRLVTRISLEHVSHSIEVELIKSHTRKKLYL